MTDLWLGILLGIPAYIGLVLLIARAAGVSHLDTDPLDIPNPYARLEKGARK